MLRQQLLCIITSGALSPLYGPPGFVDGEDGEGNAVPGGWKGDEDPCTGMEAVTRTSSNR